ncbi:MAG: type II/IV secretion system ATPase subunit [Desulfurococcaceae archaeon]
MSTRVVSSYSLSQYVTITIVEGIDGKMRYIVYEPVLNDLSKRILAESINRVYSDTKLLKSFSHASKANDFSYALSLARLVTENVAKSRLSAFKKMLKAPMHSGLITESELSKVAYYIARDLAGYGPIDPLLRDPRIEDVTCNGVGIPIYVFHNEYEWLETNIAMPNEESMERVIRKLSYRTGREPSVAQPIVEGVLNPEGYRVHIVLDTVSRRGHSFTIRKFREKPFTIIELINRGTIDPCVSALLWLAVDNKLGVIFYGPTGSGKTTLMNAISMLLPSEIKIVSVEDTPEVNLPFHDNWVPMTTRLSYDSAVQSVTLQVQVESALRQRPDVLILGEIRSREAYAFFQAVSTGHGGLTTIHSESVESLIERLIAPPMSVPKSLLPIAKLLVNVVRLATPKGVLRKVMYVHELEGYSPATDSLTTKILVKWYREVDEWRINVRNNSLFKAIAELNAVSYGDVVNELVRRATVLAYAAKKEFDIASLHVLIRRYRREPEKVFEEAVEYLKKPYEVKELVEAGIA